MLAQLREQFFSSEKNRLALNVCSRYFYPPALYCSFSTETCFKVGPFGGMSPEKLPGEHRAYLQPQGWSSSPFCELGELYA